MKSRSMLPHRPSGRRADRARSDLDACPTGERQALHGRPRGYQAESIEYGDGAAAIRLTTTRTYGRMARNGRRLTNSVGLNPSVIARTQAAPRVRSHPVWSIRRCSG